MVPEEKAKLALFIFSTEDPTSRLSRSIAEDLLEYSKIIEAREKENVEICEICNSHFDRAAANKAEVNRLKKIMVETWEGLLRPAYPPIVEATAEQSKLLLQFTDPIEDILRWRTIGDLEE